MLEGRLNPGTQNMSSAVLPPHASPGLSPQGYARQATEDRVTRALAVWNGDSVLLWKTRKAPFREREIKIET